MSVILSILTIANFLCLWSIAQGLTRIPIVYVYTVVPAVCPRGLPAYIQVSLKQAVLSQPDAEIVFASNLRECQIIRKIVENIPGLTNVDSSAISSNRTQLFSSLAKGIFQSDHAGELWVTSALRFFIMEDLMLSKGYHEMLHVEADNMLYGNISSILPVLREGYRGLAATPLTAAKTFTTASVLWISNLPSLLRFNNYLLELGNASKQGEWGAYLKWLRPHACCKHGGVDQDQSGNGIKPFAINEMSMLSHYHFSRPSEFSLFPVVPIHKYYVNRYVVNMSWFEPGGSEVGPATGDGIWDPNSWGQYLGGTSEKGGRDKKFTDPTHVIGQAIRLNGDCKAQMLCANRSYSSTFSKSLFISPPVENAPASSSTLACFTAPFARCSPKSPWTPLWNLHVHSKHTSDFASVPCACTHSAEVDVLTSFEPTAARGAERTSPDVLISKTASAATEAQRKEDEDFMRQFIDQRKVLPNHKLPIIFVYTVVPTVCQYGLPDYVEASLEQAVLSQPDAEIILAANFAECPLTKERVRRLRLVKFIDCSVMASNRTRRFMAAGKAMFQQDHFSELWSTAALRFLVLEDVMRQQGFREAIHIEADNMLYGHLPSILPGLRKNYPGLAATPLDALGAYTTASVFWIANLTSLERFNDFMFVLSKKENGTIWTNYTQWLRPFACCRPGGVAPDEKGLGIKPFAVNEMSMLSYYHMIRPDEMMFLPTAPDIVIEAHVRKGAILSQPVYIEEYIKNAFFKPDGKFVNVTEWSRLGTIVGPPFEQGLFDPGSYGQNLGGTHRKQGKDKGYTDMDHVIGQALQSVKSCKVKMLCANRTFSASMAQRWSAVAINASQLLSTYEAAWKASEAVISQAVWRETGATPPQNNSVLRPSAEQISHASVCMTAPFTRCGEEMPWVSLFNLHAHNKHSQEFLSFPCECGIDPIVAAGIKSKLEPSSTAAQSDGVYVPKHKLPIIFVYTVVPAVCKHGLPKYIQMSLEQAIMSQPDAEVILASNIGECAAIYSAVEKIHGLTAIDSTLLTSNRTREFAALASNILQPDFRGELWVTSALRFFIMEDVMLTRGYTEMLHVEADNLLYGNITGILPALRSRYSTMAATPLTVDKTFVTASVLWIANVTALERFNNYLLQLGTANLAGEWGDFLKWIRPYACCKYGGIAQDAKGMGIKPYSVNEMSMMAYYHHSRRTDFMLLPVAPEFSKKLPPKVVTGFVMGVPLPPATHTSMASQFSSTGPQTGGPTGDGIWDPNSWGQFLGGTSMKKGRDKGFFDNSHIVGRIIKGFGCSVEMLCAGAAYSSTFLVNIVTPDIVCVTAPFVKCGDTVDWTPLFNLHVHSKHTANYRSEVCNCSASIDHTAPSSGPSNSSSSVPVTEAPASTHTAAAGLRGEIGAEHKGKEGIGKHKAGLDRTAAAAAGGSGGGGASMDGAHSQGHSHTHNHTARTASGSGKHHPNVTWLTQNSSYLHRFSIQNLTKLKRLSTVTRSDRRIPIVYVYVVVKAVCEDGLPEYIQASLEQALFSQPDAEVVLTSNFAECPQIKDTADKISNVTKIDSSRIASDRTRAFNEMAQNLFQKDDFGELWVTSALRFLIMEDVMVSQGYTEMIHVEADNLLYGNLTSLLPVLRSGYQGMAATPLNGIKTFTTASVLWIYNVSTLERFNDYLLRLGTNEENEWTQYLTWLRPFACCRYGGVAPDESGLGIKPFAVNEMSMLSYYHKIRPDEMIFFPVVPAYTYYLNRYVVNMSDWGPGGRQVGPPTMDGIWDPNSWGQYLGGTHAKKGRDKKFTDSTHVVGQALRLNGECKVEMLCANQTYSSNFALPWGGASSAVMPAASPISPSTAAAAAAVGGSGGASSAVNRICVTAPFTRCDENKEWTPLWNLHVHSKHTAKFRSELCTCKG